MLQRLIEKSGLTQSAMLTMLLQIGSIAIVVISNILLTRWLGDYEFARYSYIVSWLQLLVPVALFGLYDLTLKELATLVAQGDEGLTRHFIKKILIETGLFSLIISILVVSVSFGAGKGELYENRYTMLAGAPTIIFFAYILQVQAILRCYNRATAALLSEKIVRPALIIGIVGFYFIFKNNEHTALLGVGWATVCTFLSAVFSGILLAQTIGVRVLTRTNAVSVRAKAQTPFKIDRKAQYYFLLLSILGIAFIRIDALLLGELGYINDVGIYNIATRFTDLMGIVLQTMTFMVVPSYAILAKNKDTEGLQQLVTRTARITFLGTIPLFIGLLVFGKFVLGIHSAAFEAGYPLLVILGIANLIYTFLGDSNYLLLMQGHSRTAFACMLSGFVCAVCLEIILIPKYGMVGAAFGRAAGSLVLYFGTAFMVWRKSRIVPGAFGKGF